MDEFGGNSVRGYVFQRPSRRFGDDDKWQSLNGYDDAEDDDANDDIQNDLEMQTTMINMAILTHMLTIMAILTHMVIWVIGRKTNIFITPVPCFITL